MKYPNPSLSLALIILTLASLHSGRAANVTVTVGNFSFTPASLSIGQGDTVTWTNGGGTHTSTSGTVSGGALHPDSLWGGSVTVPGFSVTFNNYAGRTYPYYCMFHGVLFGMVGSITITNAPVLQPTLTGPTQTSSQFSFTINGLKGQTNVVQGSPDCVNWSSLNTNLALSDSYNFTNSTDTSTLLGVYRVRLIP